jgi:hypothetical protein
MTWALTLVVFHSVQLPSLGAGAVMLPHSEKIKRFNAASF